MHGFVQSQSDVRVVVACDCFKSRREKFAADANDFYKAKVCQPVADWREVLARDDVDGGAVVAIDRWKLRSHEHVLCSKSFIEYNRTTGDVPFCTIKPIMKIRL